MCVCVCVCVYVCVFVCVCVFIHLFKNYLQQQFVGWRATSAGHLPMITRPVLCLMRYGQTVADESPAPPLTPKTSLVIRYYRCRDLETCLMLNQSS